MARQTYSEDTKAAAMASLLEGQSVSAVAKEYEIPVGTVKGWKSKVGGSGQVPTQKTEEIGELLVGYLQTNLHTLRAQSEFFADREWLSKQTASEVAVLHGVITDKSIRLLEAMGGSEDESH